MTLKQRKNEQLFDIVAQVAILAYTLFNIQMILWMLFIGGAWQVIGNFYHISAGGSLSKNRRKYWKWARFILIVLATSGLLFLVAENSSNDLIGGIVMLGAFISFIGGVILYITYLILSVIQFSSFLSEEKEINPYDE